MENWISAVLINNEGEKEYHQFDNEEELRYFLSCNEGYRVKEIMHYEE